MKYKYKISVITIISMYSIINTNVYATNNISQISDSQLSTNNMLLIILLGVSLVIILLNITILIKLSTISRKQEEIMEKGINI
ncbi:MAG: hypothetical protein ACTTGJ_02545 [Clostridium sp.]